MGTNYVFKCPACGHIDVITDRNNPPSHCGFVMRRSYKDEGIGVTYKGQGWARRTPSAS
jgi:predicted nucleic acid-binding Zn ribbon protein